MNERKRHAQRVCNSRSSLRSSSIRADNDRLLEVGDGELDVFPEKMATVKVVHWDVEEALVLRVV